MTELTYFFVIKKIGLRQKRKQAKTKLSKGARGMKNRGKPRWQSLVHLP